MQPLSSSRGRGMLLLIIIVTITVLCRFFISSNSNTTNTINIKNDNINIVISNNGTVCGIAAAASSNASSPCYNNEYQYQKLLPLNLNNSYSFLHISKCGGVSWFQELRKLLPKDKLYLSYPDGHPAEHGLYYQNNLMTWRYNETDYYKLVTFRSPRLHVYSQFRHCSFSDWGHMTTVRNGNGFPRDDEDVMTNFHRWLDHFINITTKSNNITSLDSFGCYHPVNLQSRFLTTNSVRPFIPTMDMNYFRDYWMPYPNYTEVEHNLHAFDWVGLTDFFHESKCILYHRLVKGDHGIMNETITTMITKYLDSTCTCSSSSSNSSAVLEQDVKFEHTTTYKRDSMLEVSDEIVNKIDALTFIDQDLYRAALGKFIDDIISLEFEIGRCVICDTVLETASLELAYLGINIKDEVYDKRQS